MQTFKVHASFFLFRREGAKEHIDRLPIAVYIVFPNQFFNYFDAR